MNVETGKKDGVYNIKTDVTWIDSKNSMVYEMVKEYGKIDVLVNNAGINLPRLIVDVYSDERNYEITEHSFNKMIAVNQKGIVFVTQAVVKRYVS